MTLHPVLPPPLLGAVVIILMVAQTIALRRWYASKRSRTALWRWFGVTVAALMLLAAAARPVIGDDQDVVRNAGDLEPNVFLVIDRSPDMAVQDMGGPSRMDVARDDVEELIGRYPHARFAVIEFASAPSLRWPLSADTWSLRPVLSNLVPYAYGADAVTQANAGAASTLLRYQLISATAQYPRAKNLVFYLGAGAPDSRVPPREFDPPAGVIDGGTVLGYGTPTGGPIPGTDVAMAGVGDTALRAVAEQLAVPYVSRTGSARLADVLPVGDAAGAPATTVTAPGRQIETYWLPALAAAILVLIELYLVLRDFRRNRFVRVRAPL
jgi:Ca-activated chloride channel homolog